MTDNSVEGGKAEEIQKSLESKMGSFGRGKYGRILQMAHTPDRRSI